jgi:hypothetical protein
MYQILIQLNPLDTNDLGCKCHLECRDITARDLVIAYKKRTLVPWRFKSLELLAVKIKNIVDVNRKIIEGAVFKEDLNIMLDACNITAREVCCKDPAAANL